jgi:hypothetical protein
MSLLGLIREHEGREREFQASLHDKTMTTAGGAPMTAGRSMREKLLEKIKGRG